SQPATIHDFGGFPEALYRMTYPAPGSPDLARRAASLLREGGVAVALDETRGLDHGAWIPLMLMFPEHDIPVVQMSLTTSEDPAFYERVGALLRPLRDEGVLIVASGSASHNLHAYFTAAASTPAPDWVEAFVQWLAGVVESKDRSTLRRYKTDAPFAQRNHPTQEHFLPIFVALGAAREDESASRIHQSFDRGVLAMDAFAWGDMGEQTVGRMR
ncbi:MAG: dioxygenase, partial [Parvularculaceae bacterium]|nr:dioxygenase [Parvularculaceae bacterium]